MHDAAPMTGLNPTHCAELVPIICIPLNVTAPARLRRDRWYWRELPGCALAFFLPEGAAVPAVDVCTGLIFGAMVEMCATRSRFNGAGVNVDRLPGFGSDGTAVEGGEARFLMAPQRVTG